MATPAITGNVNASVAGIEYVLAGIEPAVGPAEWTLAPDTAAVSRGCTLSLDAQTLARAAFCNVTSWSPLALAKLARLIREIE
jgi:hypothetical protein